MTRFDSSVSPSSPEGPVTLFLRPHFDVVVRPGQGELGVRVQTTPAPLQWPVQVQPRPN